MDDEREYKLHTIPIFLWSVPFEVLDRSPFSKKHRVRNALFLDDVF